MKRTLICMALSLGMVLPGISQARGYHDGGYYNHGAYNRGDYHGGYGRGDDRGHDGYRHDGFGRAAVLPLILGAAAVGLVADVIAAPFQAVNYAPPPPVVYYPPQPVYEYAPPPPPPQTCTVYPDGSSYCR
ncbi:MAG: hypothetical protein ACRETM_07120 [Stenotrophobium sp.]